MKDPAELGEQYAVGAMRETDRGVQECAVGVRAWGGVHLADSRKAVPSPEVAGGLLSPGLLYQEGGSHLARATFRQRGWDLCPSKGEEPAPQAKLEAEWGEVQAGESLVLLVSKVKSGLVHPPTSLLSSRGTCPPCPLLLPTP